eukprot:scaffold5673_cov340-Chaetoceros_neogracile.AAC.3
MPTLATSPSIMPTLQDFNNSDSALSVSENIRELAVEEIDERKLLEFYLKIEDFSKNDGILFRTYNKSTMMPTKAIRASDQDWRKATTHLIDFLKKSKSEQQGIKSASSAEDNAAKGQIAKNIEFLNSPQQKVVAIRSVAGGGEIALGLGVNVDSLVAFRVEDEEISTRPPSTRPPKNDETYLRMFLLFGGKGIFKFDRATHWLCRTKRSSYKPAKSMRFSSSDPKIAMENLYDYLTASKNEQSEMKTGRFDISRSDLDLNESILTSRFTAHEMIESTDNGVAIAQELNWNENDFVESFVAETQPIPPKTEETFLRMLLLFGGKTDFDSAAALIMFPRPSNERGNVLKVYKQVQFSDHNPLKAMQNLFDFLAAPKDQQSRLKKEDPFIKTARQAGINMKYITSKNAIVRTIESVENGWTIANELNWSVENLDQNNDDDVEPFMGIATSTPSRAAFVRGRQDEERLKRKYRLSKYEPIRELHQIQLARNCKLANDASLAVAKFLDATYHPLHCSTGAPLFSAMLIIVQETNSISEAGGRPAKKSHFSRSENPEVTVISNNELERKRIFTCMQKASSSSEGYTSNILEQDGKGLTTKIGTMIEKRKSKRRRPNKKDYTGAGFLPLNGILYTPKRTKKNNI